MLHILYYFMFKNDILNINSEQWIKTVFFFFKNRQMSRVTLKFFHEKEVAIKPCQMGNQNITVDDNLSNHCFYCVFAHNLISFFWTTQDAP